jgi:CheY-like chemotaxis protein
MSGQARIWDGGAAHLTAAESKQSALPAPRVLVIDRDSLHRMIICRAADKAGYVPAGAANLAEATKHVQSDAFDCITL